MTYSNQEMIDAAQAGQMVDREIIPASDIKHTMQQIEWLLQWKEIAHTVDKPERTIRIGEGGIRFWSNLDNGPAKRGHA